MRFVSFLLIYLLTQMSDPPFIFSQRDDTANVRQLFGGFLDSMIRVPFDAQQAWELTVFDSAENQMHFANIVLDQDIRIKNIERQIDSTLKKKNMFGHIRPRGNDPGNNRPGTVGNPENFPSDMNFNDMREDLYELNTAMDRIEVTKQQFKNEINRLQDSVNIKLKKTLQKDYAAHLNIINDFIGRVSKLYEKNLNILKENTRKTDEIIERYDYGEKVKFTPMELEIIKTQSAQAKNLKFFFNIIKEFIMLGSNFYRESI